MQPTRPNKTDAGNGSYGICRVINASRSPSPDPKRSAKIRMRDVAPLFLVPARGLGVCLAVMMILGSPFADFRFDWPPPAELFISRSPMALYLFGWFLLPYFFVRPKILWWILFLPLLVASVILVNDRGQ
jgi:hypothetical protein